MLFRFSLYGFLKNQRYFEPFLVLFLLERGLTFFWIGLLVGFCHVCVNVMEIPTGAVADLYGRRRCMVMSMTAYVCAFVIFATSHDVVTLFGAMFFFAIGEAFRTGTHKAIILHWLRREGRVEEKTRTYGYTRSWSKVGSAVSVAIGAAIVLVTRGYTVWLFWLTLIPYVINTANLWSYPRYLDGAQTHKASVRGVLVHLRDTLVMVWRRADLRRLLWESMAFEGVYGVVKDYLQPVLRALAIGLMLASVVDADGRAALIIAPVYVALELLSSVASRVSHRTARWWGGEEGAARHMWWINLLVFAALTPLLVLKLYVPVAAGFILLAILQNLWRPVQVSRYDTHSQAEQSATILSIDSQAKALAMAVMAPLLGLCIDLASPGVSATAVAEKTFWPVGVLGLVASAGIVLACRKPLQPLKQCVAPDSTIQ